MKLIFTLHPRALASDSISFSVKLPRVILFDRFWRVCPDASANSPIVIFCRFIIRRSFSATEISILSPPVITIHDSVSIVKNFFANFTIKCKLYIDK